MRRNLTLTIGLLWFAIAWFLPVHKHGSTLPEVLPGWQAFLVSLSPLWEKGDPNHLYNDVLSVASAGTNLFMLILPFAWYRRREHFIQLIGWACIISVGLNAHWFLSDLRSDLRVGYFLWWLSFGVVGIACLLPSLQREFKAGTSRPKPGIGESCCNNSESLVHRS